ncbi:type VI secretion system baseplate subunit TssF [Edaphovirga cremea]|uniref:type VI secretion system baseplate subunit TssF n=1 Tax=Edaphovirga cremea TaxID=2267246 RepID=UPI003988BFCF
MDSFEALYHFENKYMRELSKLVAQENPKLEAFIGPSSADPDVEKLIEGFSVLSAGVRKRIDDAFPELTENILSRIWAFPLQSIPSTSIVQFTPKKGHQTVKSDISAGSVVASGLGIEFKTCRDLHIEPLTLVSKKLSLSNDNSLIELTFRYNDEGKQWHPEPFSLYLGSDQNVAAQLRLWMDQYQSESHVLYNESSVRISQGIAFTHDYCAKSLVIPHEQENYWSVQLLAEYFYLPHVSDFISIDLSQAFPTLDRPEAGFFTIQLKFDGLLPLTQHDIEQSFFLNCVPVINLQQKSAKKIPFNADTHRYDIPVTQEQIFKLLAVYTDKEPDDEKQGERHVFTPIPEQHRHIKLGLETNDTVYYEFIIQKDVFEKVEYSLRFYDASTNPLTETHYVNFACDYLALHNHAQTLAVREINRPGIDTSSLWSVQNITPATPSYPAITNSHIHWRLMDQLSFNPVSFNHIQAVKQTIQGFNLHSANNAPLARKLQQQIDSLSAIQYRPVDRLFKGQVKRGIQLEFTLDETHFENTGAAYVFAEVLAHFFSFAIAENSFLLTRIIVKGTGETWSLPDIPGSRKMM